MKEALEDTEMIESYLRDLERRLEGIEGAEELLEKVKVMRKINSEIDLLISEFVATGDFPKLN